MDLRVATNDKIQCLLQPSQGWTAFKIVPTLTSNVNPWRIMINMSDEPLTLQHDDNSSTLSNESQDNLQSQYDDDNNSIDSTDDPTELNDLFVGDILNEAKPDNVTRIYTQNINGIKWTKEGGTWPMICETMAAIHADISCFTELNLDANRYQISNTMRNIEKKFFRHSRFSASTSNNKVPHDYKPGGTGMLIVENSTATIKKFTRDRMGRWVVSHLTGEDGKKIAVIVAYQVCQSKVTGNTTAANCQIAQLITESGNDPTTPNPRIAFIDELSKMIQKFQANEESIILLGDFNTFSQGCDA